MTCTSKASKGILAVFLALTVFCSILPLSSAAQATETVAEPARYGRQALSEEPDGASLVYAYDCLVEGYRHSTERITVQSSAYPVTPTQLSTVVKVLRSDYPEFFWMGNSYALYWDGTYATHVVPEYSMTGSALDTAKIAVEAAATALLEGLDGKSDYDIALSLHNRLADRVTYEMVGEHQTIYGALVEGKAVCSGYASAYQYLLQKMGIASWKILGTSRDQAHAWNLVQLDGEWYYTDVTWDDQDDSENRYYGYLNITTEQLALDHTTDTFFADHVPLCTATAANYYAVTGGIMETFDAQEILRLMEQTGGSMAQVYVTGDTAAFLNQWSAQCRTVATAIGVVGGFAISSSRLGQEIILRIITTDNTLSGYIAATVSGTATLSLWKHNTASAAYTTTAAVNSSYAFTGVRSGEYILRVELAGQETVEYPIIIGVKNVTQDVSLSCAHLNWASATCITPKTCIACGMTEGIVLGHTWTAATCTVPKTCSTCGAIEGAPADHTYKEGACTVCGEQDPTTAKPISEETKGTVKLAVYALPNNTHRMVISGTGAMPAALKNTTGYTTYKTTTTEILVEDGVTALAYGSFQNFKALGSITLPATLTDVPALSFSGCSALKAIDLTNVKTIGNKAFMASGLTEVTVPGTVTLGDAVFYGCTSLITAHIGNVYYSYNGALKLWLPPQTFVNCTALKTVTFGNKLNTIHTASFKNTGLESVTIPDNIKTISSNAFVGNKRLKTLILQPGVRTVGYNAFAACTALEVLSLPDSVTGASTGAFYSCYALKKVAIGTGLTKTGTDMFLDNRALTTVTLPDTMTELAIRTFSKCGQLTVIDLPANLTTIQKLAFFACYSLPEIKIPEKVTTIGDNAFDGCKALATVYVDSATVAKALTTNKAAGCLVRYADTVYIRSDIPTIGAYITANYQSTGTVTTDGVTYTVYTR